MTVDVRRRRLTALAAGLPLAAGFAPTARSQTAAAAQSLAAPVPLVQIAAGESGLLLAVARDGRLYALGDAGWQPLGEGLDPRAPLAAAHGRVAGRAAAGGSLWVLEGGRVAVAAGPALGPHAGFSILPAGIIAVAAQDDSRGVLVRFEPGGAGWRETDRGRDAVLPDARPLQLDPEAPLAAAGNGHIVVLAGPDAQRYPHGVLGDRIEATRLLYVERHALTPLRTLTLPAPYVFEDLAPRPVEVDGRAALLTMRSGPQGAQLVLVGADPQQRDALALRALGAPIGQANRWLSPATDGRRIAAVHTPHIGGVLHEYRVEGDTLAGRRAGTGLTAHRIGSRELSLALWSGDLLALPTQDLRALRFIAPGAGAAVRAEIALPAPLAAVQGWTRAGRPGVAALLDDGTLVWAPRP